MPAPDRTPEATELGEVLLAPCNACGHWPGDHHVDTGCRLCRCSRDMLAVEVDGVLASTWLAQRDARIKAEALRAAADGWDAGEGPGIPTAGWLRDRADRVGTDIGAGVVGFVALAAFLLLDGLAVVLVLDTLHRTFGHQAFALAGVSALAALSFGLVYGSIREALDDAGHVTTDPLCHRHRQPRTRLQLWRFDRARGRQCILCRREDGEDAWHAALKVIDLGWRPVVGSEFAQLWQRGDDPYCIEEPLDPRPD